MMKKAKTMKDKEKGFTEIIKDIIAINSSQRDDINNLRAKNIFYRDILNKQFVLLCKYANLFKNENDSKPDSNYTELCKLLKDYGLESFSCELAQEVSLMERNHKGGNNDR